MIDLGRSSVLQVAELAWNSMRREFQIRPVSGSRDVVGEARGVLSDRFDITADAALALVKRLAARSDSSVDEVSRHLVKGAESTELKRQLIREGTRC